MVEKEKKLERLQFNVTSEFVGNMDALADELDVSRVSIFKDAMCLLLEHARRAKSGYSLIYEKPGDPTSRVEIVLPQYVQGNKLYIVQPQENKS